MKDIWNDFNEIEAVLPERNQKVQAAWQRVIARAMTPYIGASPPTTDPRPRNEWGADSNQISKTGWIDDVPLPNTIGMERLLFRIVKALELLAGALPGVDVGGELLGIESEIERLASRGKEGALSAASGSKHWAVSEAFQVSYCDFCGAALKPDRSCRCD